MINLKLTDESRNGNQAIEYYQNGFPAKFLIGVKDVNVIVGANNSRKSRFLRRIMALETKVLVEGDEMDLNAFISRGDLVVQKVLSLNSNGLNGNLLSIRGSVNNEGGKNASLGQFFRESKVTFNIVNTTNLQTLVETIILSAGKLLGAPTTQKLAELVDQLKVVCELLLYLYKHIEANGGKLVSSLSYPEGPFKAMVPVVPDIKSQRDVPFVAETIEAVGFIKAWISTIVRLESEMLRASYIYIPVLRTSRALENTNGDVFLDTILKQHFETKMPINLDIATGLKLYDKINFARNGVSSLRASFAEFENFIGSTFFKTTKIDIVAHVDSSNQKTINITVPGQKEDVPIYDLGDGIQGVINLLFPVFTAKTGAWIFIDEPENHLHPGFQTIFIKAISENEFIQSKKLRFFINTHSNHILSEAFLSSSDVGIFVFSNKDSNSSNISSFNQDQYSTLELLGVMNTSVFITNCTVWVEGITDRFYLRAFLHAYCLSLSDGAFLPTEGFDYSFIEYAGKNLVHYDFDQGGDENIASYFLNANVFLLADSDFDEKKHTKYENIKRDNFKYKKTVLPEIENLLPVSVIKSFLLDNVGCDESSLPNLSKSIHHTKLGKALKSVTKKGKLIPIEASSGGTLSSAYKSKLSKYVYERILAGNIDWLELKLSAQLAEIVEELYEFIKSKNGK